MKIEKSEISSRLAKLKSAIPKKDQASGVRGVLIRDNTAIANNYDLCIKATLPVEAETPFVLPLKAIEMIDSLPDGVVSILAIDGNCIHIETGGIKNTFIGLKPEDFAEPAAPDDSDRHLTIDSKKLYAIVSSVMYAASVTDARPIASGVLFEAKDGYLNVVALDGHRAAWNKTEFDGDYKFVVPRASLEKLIKLGIAGDIEIALGKNSAVFASGEYTVYTRLISGEFFNYRKAYPTHDQQIVVNRKDFLDSIGRILICFDDKEQTPLVMTFAEKKMILSLTSSTAHYTEEIEVHGEVNRDMRIGFSSHYLRDAAKSYDAEFVTMSFGSTTTQPMVMSDDELLSLVLPVRLNDDGGNTV